MYRSASLDLPDDTMNMPPPSRIGSRSASRNATPPVLKLSRPAENGSILPKTPTLTPTHNNSIFGDVEKVSKPADSISVNTKPVEPAEAIENDSATKRRIDGVDMRPYKKTRLLASFSETVKLIVGPVSVSKTFVVHKDILCAASPVFEAGFKPVWQKGGDATMELPEDDPIYFAPLVYWIYNNEIVYPYGFSASPMGGLADVYHLAEKHLMPRLQNDLIDSLVYETVTSSRLFVPRTITSIFKNSPAASKLRLFVVNSTLKNWTFVKHMACKPEDLCADFLFEIFSAFAEDPRAGLKDNFLDSENQYCELYHIHEAEEQGKCKALKLPEHVASD
ncbi:hypothetical protein BCON_0064g00040 [Botryotinia convoluta]|uniref:BTB domain-containing protein n=1 Tax=Botryotinia convoluta TaxID=54673 RepID=A0A4Z1ILF7_9HELO|nr:hypothetical protein BCON_0064g00040 [Botryotinia convoluta]